MFCKYCGAEIPDGAAFCPKCGQQVAGTNPSAEHAGQTTGSTGTTYGGGTARPQSSYVSRSNAVTEMGKSTLMLVFTIFLSVELLFSLLGVSLSVLNLLSLLIGVIVCVGCWMVYAGSSQNSAPATGFSVLRIGVPLQMVIMLIGAIASIVSAVRWSYGVATVLGYLIEIVLVCWCFYGLYHVTNDGRKMANGEAVRWNVTPSCFVTFIILVIFEVIGMIVSLLYASNVAALVSYLATTVVWILAAAILSAIRKQH